MKLIIDINEYAFERIKEYYDALSEDSTVDAKVYYIANGIPLDKIRAEIIKHFEGCYLEEDMTDERKAEHKAYENVLQIIDKYTK